MHIIKNYGKWNKCMYIEHPSIYSSVYDVVLLLVLDITGHGKYLATIKDQSVYGDDEKCQHEKNMSMSQSPELLTIH